LRFFQCYEEAAALSQFGGESHRTSHAFGRFSNDGKPDTRPFIFFVRIYAAKDLEDIRVMTGIDSDSIVFETNADAFGVSFGRDPNHGDRSGRDEFYRIRE
jgi:hypothetical protein